jgi:hypothetical protein
MANSMPVLLLIIQVIQVMINESLHGLLLEKDVMLNLKKMKSILMENFLLGLRISIMNLRLKLKKKMPMLLKIKLP